MNNDKHNTTVTVAAPVGWFGGWMFTIGFAHLSVGQTFLALVIWPYYIGSHFFQ